jgi:hypothetical protein
MAVTSAVNFLYFETIATAPPQKRKLTELCEDSPESPKMIRESSDGRDGTGRATAVETE